MCQIPEESSKVLTWYLYLLTVSTKASRYFSCFCLFVFCQYSRFGEFAKQYNRILIAVTIATLSVLYNACALPFFHQHFKADFTQSYFWFLSSGYIWPDGSNFVRITSVLCDLNLSCFQMYKMKRHCTIAPNEIICDLFIICHLFFNHVLVQSYTMSLSLSWLHYVDNVLVAKSQIQTRMRLANTSEKLSWQLSHLNITNIQLFFKMTVVTYLWMFNCLLWLLYKKIYFFLFLTFCVLAVLWQKIN